MGMKSRSTGPLELLSRFDDPGEELLEKNAALAASLVRGLVDSSSWGEVPVAPAFTALLSVIPVRHGWPRVEVEPTSPREVRIEFPVSTDDDPRPSMHALARAFGLANPRVASRGILVTGAGAQPCWALEGLPPDVQCEALQQGPRQLGLVRPILVRRPEVPEREDEPATAELAEGLKAIHRAIGARDERVRPYLSVFSHRFPVTHNGIVQTGLWWIDVDRLWRCLGHEAGAPIQTTLATRGPGGLPMRTPPSLTLELPLSGNRVLDIEAYFSTGRWVRALHVGRYRSS
jgi:hypothetical protein